MVKREHFDQVSIGGSNRITSIEGSGLSIDQTGNLNATGGGGESAIAEDFDTGDLSEYAGDTGVFSVVAGDIAGGDMLEFNDDSGASQAIYNPNIQTRRGMSYAAYMRLNAVASPTFVVCGQDDGTSLTGGYGVFISSGLDEARLVTNPMDALNTSLDTVAIAINTGTIYRVEIDLGFNTVQARVIDDTETVIANLSGVDGTMDTGSLAWRDASGQAGTSNFDFAIRQPFMTGP